MRLPLGEARTKYVELRKQRVPVARALAAADHIMRAEESYACAKCGCLLHPRDPGDIRPWTLELWCSPCVMEHGRDDS